MLTAKETKGAYKKRVQRRCVNRMLADCEIHSLREAKKAKEGGIEGGRRWKELGTVFNKEDEDVKKDKSSNPPDPGQ